MRVAETEGNLVTHVLLETACNQCSSFSHEYLVFVTEAGTCIMSRLRQGVCTSTFPSVSANLTVTSHNSP